MRYYLGFRDDSGCHVYWWDLASVGKPKQLPLRLDIRSHSPTGFEWGYGGSGPAQLALGLALHVLEDRERAERVYQFLKRRLVMRLARECWSVSGQTVAQEIMQIEDDLRHQSATMRADDSEDRGDQA
jgi:hypothetical protein